MIVKFKNLEAWVYHECETVQTIKDTNDVGFEYDSKETVNKIHEDTDEIISFIDMDKLEFPTKNLGGYTICMYKGKDDSETLYTNQRVYIMNNQGQTIERIN